MSDVLAIFGLLALTGLAFPGLLTAWSLLFPNVVARARNRVERTPWATFGMGLIGLVAAGVPLAVLLALPFAPAKFLGWAGVFLTLTFASLGAAGIAAQMGARIARQPDAGSFGARAFVYGAVCFELAAAFPVLGWFIVTPVWIITSMGAAIFGALNWMPRLRPISHPAFETPSG